MHPPGKLTAASRTRYHHGMLTAPLGSNDATPRSAGSNAALDEIAEHVVESREDDAACLAGSTRLRVLETVASANACFERIAATSPDRERRACRAGCSSCCHMSVSMLPIEAIYISVRLRDHLTPAEYSAAYARIAATERRVSHLTIEERALARVPCALLDEQGACSIHPFRPLGCRGWTSFSKADCDAALTTSESGHSGPQDRIAFWAAGCSTEGLERGLRRAGLHAQQLEFHSALRRALDHPDAAERYARGEPLFQSCARVRSDRLRRAEDAALVPPLPAEAR
ncbi:MAG: hypothetical protein CHACPFDD_03068 [Phycisphaerae bacterium]|nr:hypothetical protein [Phycisphaerae bacterium]